jgi:exosome complex component RRP41
MEHVVFTENYPRTSIDVYIEVLQANAGTRCAGLTAAAVALADAGIPMRDMVPAVAVGKVNDQVVLDLNKEEDNFGQADLPIAMIPRTGEILLLQMDGHLTQAEFDRAMELGVKACGEIYELQKDALRRRYAITNSGEAEDETKDEPREMNEEA